MWDAFEGDATVLSWHVSAYGKSSSWCGDNIWVVLLGVRLSLVRQAR